MLELSVRFTSDEKKPASPIKVALFCPQTGAATDPVRFTPPLDDPALDTLRWYLEVFAGWPTGPDYERARQVEAAMEGWGRALLDSILPGAKAPRLWQQFLDAPDAGKLVTLDATDPRVLRLPWELLADEGGHLFARGLGVRRRLQQATTTPLKPFGLPVRVLVVVSRPDGAGFIDPRAVSLPLLDALDRLGERVAVEFLYPPTLAALTARLADTAAPPVHVVHFDGHGVYDVDQGLGFLIFEDDEHKIDHVDADRLGTLLFDCGVPLMVLNACQSAKQEEANPYASVAARLIRSGVGSVLAMSYSVLVVAARKFVETFYGDLAAGGSVGHAVDRGRRTLLADEKRHTLTRPTPDGRLVEETVRLRDWFLPTLYQRADDPVVFEAAARPAPGAGVRALPRALVDPQAPGGLPATPRHGFHGRAKEMLLLERTLAERPIAVLHGFGGLGKTALAAEAGRWFQRTGRFPGGAAFVSFEHGGSLQQLCSWAGQAVSGDPDWGLGEGEPVARVGALLRERPALVILDNFESVLGREPLMPPDELKDVLDAVYGWAAEGWKSGKAEAWQAGSRLLITTRDARFEDARFQPSRQCAHVELGGLERDDALALAAAVLDDHKIDRAGIDPYDLWSLMDRLGGHPLSLNLVLPHLRRLSPVQLSAGLAELLPGFREGAARERNESLAVSLEFSLRRLGEPTRAALPDLAVFQGGAMESRILDITGIDPELWQTARAELEGAALVSAESLPGVTVPFLRFHPTLGPYLAARLPAGRRQELEARYRQGYYEFAGYLYQLDTQHPHEARAMAGRELPNLRRALDLLAAAAVDPAAGDEERAAAGEAAVTMAECIAFFLDAFGRRRERAAVMARVEALGGSGEGGVTKAEFLLLSRRGEALLQEGRAADAERLFRGLLARLEAGPAYDAAYDHALTLWWLGRCLAAQGRPGQAVDCHRRALAELERLGESNEQAREMQGKVYADLGDNLAATGQLDEAQRAYETSLDIEQQVGDKRAIGVALAQLGNLALQRGDRAEAGRRFAEALDTFRALGEPQAEAVAWHQLGIVAQEARQWDEAERCYRESLRLKESLNDLPGVARTCNQLAIVAKGAGWPDDAERWYLRALAAFEELRNPPSQATVLNNLAGLYLSQGRLDEAERYARRAADIQAGLDLSAEPWKTFNILAGIAAARGRADEAAAWRRKANDSRDAFAGTQHQLGRILQQFEQVIAAVAAACGGDAGARAQVEGLFDRFRQGNWQIVDAIQRMWAGERDEEALTAGIDYNSRAIVRAILARLAGEAPPVAAPAARAQPRAASAAPAPAAERVRQQWGSVVAAAVAACRGNGRAAGDLAPCLDELAGQESSRALVAALRRLLAGERDPAALLPGLDGPGTYLVGEVLRGLGER